MINASKRGISKLPLKGSVLRGSNPERQTSSSTRPPKRVICAFVVVKWKFIGITSPGLTNASAKMFSQARPWCAGKKYFVPKTSSNDFNKRLQVSEPAYESSACIMAAIWLSDMALTPESVNISMKTSLFWSKKVLFPAAFILATRSSTVGKNNFCTTRTLCISKGTCWSLQ